jgi:hypothetical protein
MKCPDCGNDHMRKHGAFYTCDRCGLSLKPWEIEQARKRAREELDKLEEEDPDKAFEKKKKARRRYRNWYEGRQQID